MSLPFLLRHHLLLSFVSFCVNVVAFGFGIGQMSSAKEEVKNKVPLYISPLAKETFHVFTGEKEKSYIELSHLFLSSDEEMLDKKK